MVNRRLLSIFLAMLFMLLVVIPLTASAGRITVDLDRTILEEGESFNVEFTSEGSVDGEPDFSILDKDFRFLSQSQSSNIQFINGRMSSQKTWQLVLMPKRTGQVVIPAISFGKDKSQATTVLVKKATAGSGSRDNGLLFMETEATPKTAYIQSQVVYTLRIYHAINLVNASLSDLHVSDENAIVEKLGDDISYEKRIKGVRYKVFEKRFAIFPQQSGEIKIDPVDFEGQYVNNRRMLQSKFIHSDPITIKVKPQPSVQSAKPGDRWLPAANIKIEEQWSADLSSVKVGEPITRTVTITADGIMGAQLPELNSTPIQQIKQYPDQPQVTTRKTKEGVVGIRQEKIAYIPTKPGKFRLPAIEIPWWNTAKDRQEIARIKSYEVDVSPGVNAQGGNLTPVAPEIVAPTADSSPAINNSPNEAQPVMVQTPWYGNPWFWSSMAMIVIWLMTLLLFWRWRRSTAQLSTSQDKRAVASRNTQKQTAVERKIRQACNRDDAETVKQLLLEWGGAVWPSAPPISLGELSRRCAPQLSIAIDSLGRSLYGSPPGRWDGPAFWNTFSAHKSAEGAQRNKDALQVIQPLHKNMYQQSA